MPLTFPPGITFPTGDFLSPDTTTTKRTDFTAFFLSVPCPQDASGLYRHIFTTHQELIALLIEHPAMVPNLEQTFSTPANSKNQVYFMWDFLLRTFQILVAKIDTKKPANDAMFDHIFTRSKMAAGLMLDDTGKLKEMNKSVGHSDDDGVEFGDEVKALARKLEDIPLCD